MFFLLLQTNYFNPKFAFFHKILCEALEADLRLVEKEAQELKTVAHARFTSSCVSCCVSNTIFFRKKCKNGLHTDTYFMWCW